MARKRTPERDDLSLVVVRPEDILWTPLEGGDEFLRARALKLEKERKKLEGRGKIYVVDSPEDIEYLTGLEPTAWKDQDHYAVLGVKHLRFRATEEEIRKAYRHRVLRHHPDKRMGKGEEVNPECDYFACIVKAYETLTERRAAFDSVDPEFDDYLPPKSLAKEGDFYTVYGKWFELNSRWSAKTPVPLLGNGFTSRGKVEDFYDFWYNFESWREYSYLDEEEKEKGQYREERRWIDKQNKAARAKLKKEEMTRIRTAVDQAYNLDPRIALFKQQDSDEKQAKKDERKRVAREKFEQEEAIKKEREEEERKAREEKEREQKEKEMLLKKEKDAIKKAAKKEKKNFRQICKQNNYYGVDDKGMLDNMAHVETLAEVLQTEELEELNQKLSKLNLEEGRGVFLNKANEVNAKIEAEKAATSAALSSSQSKGSAQNGSSSKEDCWSSEELALLIKAVNLFPAGTVQRWDVVANFLHQHNSSARKRSAKEVLAKAKDLKASDFSKNSLKEEANQQAFAVFEKQQKSQMKVEAEETKREPEAVNGKGANNNVKIEEPASRPWAAEEQKMLEQALKTFPASHSDRWDRIAESVPGRTKKECMARFKELAALIKAKKMAQQKS